MFWYTYTCALVRWSMYILNLNFESVRMVSDKLSLKVESHHVRPWYCVSTYCWTIGSVVGSRVFCTSCVYKLRAAHWVHKRTYAYNQRKTLSKLAEEHIAAICNRQLKQLFDKRKNRDGILHTQLSFPVVALFVHRPPGLLRNVIFYGSSSFYDLYFSRCAFSVSKKPIENPTSLTKGVEILNRNLYLSLILSSPFAAILEPSGAQRYSTRGGMRPWWIVLSFNRDKAVLTRKILFRLLRKCDIHTGCNLNYHIEKYLEKPYSWASRHLTLPSKVTFVESRRYGDSGISASKSVLDWFLLI